MSGIYIIAEAGVNHNGDLTRAAEMVKTAKTAGADAIKFQTFKTESLVTRHAPKAAYQSRETGAGTQNDMLKALELSYDAHRELQDLCQRVGIEFLSTAFDLDSLDFLNSLGVEKIKIPSGEITNLPYLEKAAGFDKPILLSTGMSELDEIEAALEVLDGDVTILHCTTQYPAPFTSVNLSAIPAMRDYFKRKVGYSDHTLGIAVPIAAAALGACVIEKHFTLDRSLPGPDHMASLEPRELAEMITSVRHIEEALGNGIKTPQDSELLNKAVVRKSIVAKNTIAKGDLFTADNLTVKRPGNGISPMEWYKVLEKTATRDYEEDELIEL